MTKASKMSIGLLVLLIAPLFLFQTADSYAAPLDLNRSCVMHVRAGWNLMNAAELSCGLLSIYDSANAPTHFPAYLDLYAYDGTEYIYARVTKQVLKNGGGNSLESAAEKYANTSIKRGTSGRVSNLEGFSRDIEKQIKQDSALNIKEYAGRITKELLTSVWVYNPGRDFSTEYSPRSQRSDDEALVVSAIRLLSTDIGGSEWSQLAAYLENDVLSKLGRVLEREKGYMTFLREFSSGQIILESGWNFLTYSRIVSDDEGNLNFRAGDCSISKAYVFNNDSKKWVSAERAPRSLIGSGLVVYNNGGKCTLAPTNSILNRLQSLFKNSSSNTPPSLPE